MLFFVGGITVKKKCLILLLVAVVMLVQAPALAQRRPGGFGAGAAVQEEPMSEKELEEYLLNRAKEERLKKLRDEYVPKVKDYDQNTVCSFGPQFREVSPRMTDAWYMFTPIDLSEDGTQTFDLIAGNMFVIGKVSVTVQNGRFQVDYHYNSRRIEVGREYFNIFADYQSISEADLENLHAKKRFDYGKAYSIKDRLDGDTDVILFVCNTATFKKTTSGVTGYYSTHPDRVAQRNALLEMIGKAIVDNEK